MGQEHKEYTWNLIAKKFTGEATIEELRQLEELLRANPELHYPMQTISDLWNTANPTDQHIAEQAFARHVDRMDDLKIGYLPADNADQASRRHPIRRIALFVAAACAITAIIVTGFYLTRHKTSGPVAATTAMIPTLAGSEIFTGNGSRTHVALPDGTMVWLNAGSRISYEKSFNTTLRAVTLTGEAFFDVAPNANKPFTIHTAHIDIRVLGTSFNVKSYPSDKTTEATLIRGSIEISIRNRPSDKIVLKANEKLVVNNDDSIRQEEENLPRHHGSGNNGSLMLVQKPTYDEHSGAIIETSWVDNKLIFQDQDFSSLARLMERWYGVTIRFDDSGKEDLRFTGIFEKETIRQALDALRLTANSNFNYDIDGTQITIHN